MNVSDNDLALIRDYFKDKPVLKAYLFGSSVKGEPGSKSDIDILVELDCSEQIGFHYFQMQIDLRSLLNKDIDLVSGKALSRHVRPFIEKEKLLIYERSAQ